MIDLRSDTVTKPTPAMREAMAGAEVGDDIYGEDPTVNRLQEQAAALLGKARALFVPSGTMGNQLAIRALTQPGQEVIVEGSAHIVRYEQGAAGALAGVQLHWVPGRRGLMTADQVEAAIRPRDPYTIPTGLICLENTHNSGGGSIYPLSTVEQIRAVADRHGIPMHLDGARLFNAVAATGVPAYAYARHFQTVTFCLSKGLGAPAGSLIATDETDVLERLRRFRRMYGGAMRQAGVLAAAGLYALTHHIDRLKEDHNHAKELARILHTIPSVSVNPDEVETNIIFFEVRKAGRSSADIAGVLREDGLLVSSVGGSRFRAVTHLDVGAADIRQAGTILSRVLA
ncbi:MAG: aminotransferase class I/II-fold pyridoxal phosphate-dependent enzyme [Nitrospira sp.]